MGTTALIFTQEGSVGILFINMKCFVLSCLLSLSLAAPAPEAEAALGYPLFGHHVAPLAVVPVKQLQWPGVSAPGVDSTCFGCRASVVVPWAGEGGRLLLKLKLTLKLKLKLLPPFITCHWHLSTLTMCQL